MVRTASGPMATVSKLQHHRWRDRFGRGPDAPTCHHLDEGPSDEPRGYPRVLPKTAVASHRFVFVMGVESSGHHLLQRVFGNCAAQSGNTRCRDAAALRKLLSSDKVPCPWRLGWLGPTGSPLNSHPLVGPARFVWRAFRAGGQQEQPAVVGLPWRVPRASAVDWA